MKVIWELSVGIEESKRIIDSIGVAIQKLGLYKVTFSYPCRVNARESALCTRIVSRPEVIQSRLAISLFLG